MSPEEIHLSCLELNNGASAWDIYNVTFINGTTSSAPFISVPYSTYFPNTRSSKTIQASSLLELPNKDLVSLVLAPTQNISFYNFKNNNGTYEPGVAKSVDLYAESLSANFVINLDTPFVECMWVGEAFGNNLTNFIIAV